MNASSRGASGDRQQSNGDDEEDPLARDFRPPPSHVRKRPPPPLHASLREYEEGLAYQAASDQLSYRRRAYLQRGTERNAHQSSYSSASSLGNLQDTAEDLYRRPVGSFAEDSPPRERRSPIDPHFFSYPTAHAPVEHSFDFAPVDYPEIHPSSMKQESPSQSRLSAASSDGIIRQWPALLDDGLDDFYGGGGPSIAANASPSKTGIATMQDVFRSPPGHDLKKAPSGSRRTSPSLSLSALDTPGTQPHNYSPMPGFEEYADEDKQMQLGMSTDEEERFSFGTTYPAPPSLSELDGVECSPLQSSSERKTLDSRASTTSPDDVQHRERPQSVPPESKRSSVDGGSSSSQSRWMDRNPSNVRRVTMGELQSSRSLADINIMMRGQVDTSSTTIIPPETPILEPTSARTASGRRSKSPPEPVEPVPLGAIEPLTSSSQKTPAKHASSLRLPKQSVARPTSKPTSVQKASVSTTSRSQPTHLPPYRYPQHPPPPSTLPPHIHRYPLPYPPPTGALYPPEFAPPTGRSPHVPPNYHPRSASLPASYPPPALNLPPRFTDERDNASMLPGSYSVPSTPRFQAAGYGPRPLPGVVNHPAMLYPFPPHHPMTAPHYPYPNSARKGPPPPRFTPPHPLHTSAVDSVPNSVPPPAPTGKENAPATPAKGRRVPCNCKKSRCLKLYCECFSAQVFCDSCNCVECLNTERDVVSRDKAIKETLHKNRTAFEVRAPGAVSTGCKCKKSECLKKYCECFQAGIVCVDHCKCIGCNNRAGSQKLIDKRRKIKDPKGVDYALKISEEVWKQSTTGGATSGRHKPPVKQPLAYPRTTRIGSMVSLGFSPLGSISDESLRMDDDDDARGTQLTTPFKTEPVESPMETGMTTVLGQATAIVNAVTECTMQDAFDREADSPRTPAGVRRLSFDSTVMSLRKKKKHEECRVAMNEGLVDIFGPDLPVIPMSASVKIFQYLSKSDLYHASLTSKEWNIMVTDKFSP